MDFKEDEEAFCSRRKQEEEAKAAQASCLVRSAHEDLAELYEERERRAIAESAVMEDLIDRLM